MVGGGPLALGRAASTYRSFSGVGGLSPRVAEPIDRPARGHAHPSRGTTKQAADRPSRESCPGPSRLPDLVGGHGLRTHDRGRPATQSDAPRPGDLACCGPRSQELNRPTKPPSDRGRLSAGPKHRPRRRRSRAALPNPPARGGSESPRIRGASPGGRPVWLPSPRAAGEAPPGRHELPVKYPSHRSPSRLRAFRVPSDVGQLSDQVERARASEIRPRRLSRPVGPSGDLAPPSGGPVVGPEVKLKMFRSSGGWAIQGLNL